MNWVLTILGMAVVTYATKATILLLGNRIALSGGVRRALEFVPICVLTAIVVPITLAPHGGGIELTWRNPQLVAALVAVAASRLRFGLLAAITVSLAVFFAWKFLVLG
jgi:branched-subunit amino acid transport protein